MGIGDIFTAPFKVIKDTVGGLVDGIKSGGKWGLLAGIGVAVAGLVLAIPTGGASIAASGGVLAGLASAAGSAGVATSLAVGAGAGALTGAVVGGAGGTALGAVKGTVRGAADILGVETKNKAPEEA